MDNQQMKELTEEEIAKLRHDAEGTILNVLASLEASTGRRIKKLELNEIDVTRCGDTSRQILTTVRIELLHPSRRMWG